MIIKNIHEKKEKKSQYINITSASSRMMSNLFYDIPENFFKLSEEFIDDNNKFNFLFYCLYKEKIKNKILQLNENDNIKNKLIQYLDNLLNKIFRITNI